MHPQAYLSTVTQAAASYALIDIASLKTRLNIAGTASDAFLALALADASAAAARYMNNPIVAETLSDQIWPWRDACLGGLRTRAPALQLIRWPLISVSSVVETIAGTATALVAGTDYLTDVALGRLIRLDPFGRPREWNADPVTVAYSAGYAAVPGDVQEAIAEMVKARYFARSRDPATRSENVEGVLQTQYFFGSGPGAETDMTPAIAAKLDRYRAPVLM